MNDEPGLVAAYVLDGKGGGEAVDWSDVRRWSPDAGVLWAHLDRSDAACRTWLSESSGLHAPIVEALLEEETRPRCAGIDGGLLVILRGVNLNPGQDPEDMVSLRLWVERDRVISVRRRRLLAVQDVSSAFAAGTGPSGAADLLVAIADRLVDRMGPVVTDLEDEVDALEDRVVTAESHALRSELAELRRRAIMLRRYLAPQRDALSRLQLEPADWIDDMLRMRLREINDRVARYVEDLDAVRERAAVVNDELGNRLAERMNRNMYVISLVATVFLPLGFVTGLLGINVGGIPGTDNPYAFLVVCLGLAALAAIAVIVLRRIHWF